MVGCDADFAILAPDDEFVVDPAKLHPPSPGPPWTPAWMLAGVVCGTWLRGEEIRGTMLGGGSCWAPRARDPAQASAWTRQEAVVVEGVAAGC